MRICGKVIFYKIYYFASTRISSYQFLLCLKKKKPINALKGIMPKNMMRPGRFRNIERGWYKIGNKKMFFKSKWEANYALYLNFLKKQKKIKKWEYEKDVFVFEKIKFGTRSYRPDFKVINDDKTLEYHEVKGWMDKESKTKLNRMRIYYSEIKIVLIQRKEIAEIKAKLGRILNLF